MKCNIGKEESRRRENFRRPLHLGDFLLYCDRNRGISLLRRDSAGAKSGEERDAMIHIAICDDDKKDRGRLREFLCRTELSCSIAEYGDAETLLADMEDGRRQFDLLFLDIYLPEKSGVEAAKCIRRMDEDALLIFLTTSEEFYREAFDVYAFHYLIKPIGEEELAVVVKKAADRLNKTERRLSIVSHGQNMLLKHMDINYISSAGHYLHFHMKDGQEHISHDKLDDLEKRLDSDLFVRSHKSFMVNLLNIDKMTKEGFYIGDTLVPISRSYAANARENCYRQLFGEIRGEKARKN